MSYTPTETPTTDSEDFRRCPHCNVRQYGGTELQNSNADPALDAMSHLCWKCVKPLSGQ